MLYCKLSKNLDGRQGYNLTYLLKDKLLSPKLLWLSSQIRPNSRLLQRWKDSRCRLTGLAVSVITGGIAKVVMQVADGSKICSWLFINDDEGIKETGRVEIQIVAQAAEAVRRHEAILEEVKKRRAEEVET